MFDRFRPALRAALASVALGALVPLAACNQPQSDQARMAARLPDLPATMPLALGEPRPIRYAPVARDLPRARPIQAARVSDPDDYYAWADDAWGYYDALDYAPPDYGFYYDDVEPWAWQGYDDSLMFVEPLTVGYRYYFFRPGDEYPYFVRDPDWAYGYDDGRLAVVYDDYGNLIPYDAWYDEPYLDYASRYYDRGYALYQASVERHPVLASTWYEVMPSYSVASLDWTQDLWQQPQWLSYHERTYAPRESYWDQERERRQAEAVRYAAWQDSGFESLPPPRAIPTNWERASWAKNERWFAPAVSGFGGSLQEQQRAAERERQQVVALGRDTHKGDQLRLATLRETVRARPAVDTARVERVAEARRQFEARQVRLASSDDRAAQRQRAQIERQQQRLARAELQMLRQQGGENRQLRGPERLARTDQVLAREQRVQESAFRRQAMQAQGVNEQRRQQQLERRAQADQRRAQLQAEATARTAQREQARQAVEQRRAAQDEARQAAQERRAVQDRARQASQQRFELQRAARDQARQAAQNQRAAQEQARQAAQQERAARDQARQVAQQQRAAQEQARQAVQQQRAAQDQARQAAQQQRAAQEQARQAAQQQRVAQDQARQAAQQQRAAEQQARAAAQQQRAQQQQQVAQAGPDNGGKGHGRGPR